MSASPNASMSPAGMTPGMLPPNPFAGFNWGPTLGAGYMGVVISAIFYGVTCVQTFYYLRTYTKDTWTIKTLVLGLLLLDTTHQALIIHVFYHYLVIHYADPAAIQITIWSIPTEIIINAVIAFLVESFLTYRLWRLSTNIAVTGLCGSFVLAHLIMNLLFPIRALTFPDFSTGVIALKTTGTIGLSIAVVADVLLALSLSFYLNKSRTGFRRSDDMITKLITLTITTGLLTTIFVGGNLIAYVVAPHKLYILFFNFMLGKLYINSFLTSLNSREAIRKATRPANQSSQVNSFHLSHITGDTTYNTDTRVQKTLDVNVKQVVETDTY